jgi:hypothetical protein
MLPAEIVGVGEASRADATGTAASWLNPAGVALSRSYSIAGSYGYRAEDSSQIVSGGVCDSVTTRVGTCVSYNFLNAGDAQMGERKMHTVSLTMALPLADRVAIGVTGRYVHLTETGPLLTPKDDSRDGELVVDAGAVVKVGGGLSLAAVGYNLIGGDEANFRRAVAGGITWGTGSSVSISGDAVWQLGLPDGEKTGRYGVGGQYFVTADGGQQGYPLRLGYVYDAGKDGAKYLTAGLGLITPRVGLDLAMRKQVGGAVGDEVLVEAGLRLFMPND